VSLSTINGFDEATLSTAGLTAGAHTITAAYSGDRTFARSTANSLVETVNTISTPMATSMPAAVVGLKRFGFHDQQTTLVLRFSAVLDPVRAQDVSNYRIVTLSGRGRGASHIGHVTAISRAVYDPASLTVTLYPAERLDVHNIYRFTARGAMLEAQSASPNGQGNDDAPADYVAEITRATLAGPAPGLKVVARRWNLQRARSQ
jgi:hypothetical protein